MRKYHLILNLFVIVILGINMQACGSIQQMIQGTPTFTPTITLTPSPTFTATSTSTPTKTPTLTVTPNLTATQQYQNFLSVVQKYYDAGILPSLNGKYQLMDDYSDSTTEVNSYHWNYYDNKITNFIIRADIVLDASQQMSGCGFVFGSTSNRYSGFVFLQRNGSAVFGSSGFIWTTKYYSQFNYSQFNYPAEFTMVLIIYNSNLHLVINEKEVIVNNLRDQDLDRDAVGPAIFSGVSDSETRCDFTNIELWEIADS